MAQTTDDYVRQARVLRVVDGDTLDVELDLGFYVKIRQRLRLLDVDTPEVYGVKHGSDEHKKGVLASQFTRAWIEENARVEEHKGLTGMTTTRTVQVRSHDAGVSRGKYGRYLAEVYPGDGGGVSLNTALNTWMQQEPWGE